MAHEITMPYPKVDNSGITMSVYRNPVDLSTVVAFSIPDHCQIIHSSPHDFMYWVYEQLMEIAAQSSALGKGL